MKENLYQQIGKLEIKEIKKCIDQLDSNVIGFFELLDFIEILLMKSQFLENSKIIESKRKCFLYSQKYATIQKEIDIIHLKIELLIQKLRKFHPKAFD